MGKKLNKRDIRKFFALLVTHHPFDIENELFNFVGLNFIMNRGLIEELRKECSLIRKDYQERLNIKGLEDVVVYGLGDDESSRIELVNPNKVIFETEIDDSKDVFASLDQWVKRRAEERGVVVESCNDFVDNTFFIESYFGYENIVAGVRKQLKECSYSEVILPKIYLDNLCYYGLLIHSIRDFIWSASYQLSELYNQDKKEFGLSKVELLEISTVLGSVDYSNLNSDYLTLRRAKINLLREKNNLPKLTYYQFSIEEPQIKENQFNNVPLDKVREIFGVLTMNKNTVDPKGYFLKEDELNEFIDCAFLGKELKQKIKIRINPNSDVITLKNLFHTFELYSKDYEKRDRKYKQVDYIKLFTEHFKTAQTVKSFGYKFSVASKQPNKILIRLDDL